MEINLTTPALLFPAISLLLLAFTNRFLALASLIRGLYDRHKDSPDRIVLAQIESLRYRVILIRNMQALGVTGLLLCVLCMLLIFLGLQTVAKVVFGVSLLLLMLSLALSVREIQVSVYALNLQLSDLETKEARPSNGVSN